MDRVKAENARHLSVLNKEIAEGKRTHALLTKEGQELQASIKKSETEIKSNQESLKQNKQAYQTLRDKLEKDIRMYEASIAKYTAARDEKQKRLDEDTPVFLKLQEDHKTFTQTYNDRKRMVTGLKAKNAQLKNEVFVAKGVLEQLATPKKQAEDSIAKCRKETVEELERQGRDKKRLETVVAEVGEKIVCVVDQNNRLIEKCEGMRGDVNQLTEDIIDSGHSIRQLHNNCIDKRDALVSGWESNLASTLSMNERDGLVLGQMDEQERVTVERNKRLEVVSRELQLHIAHMSDFLTQVTSFRGGSDIENNEKEEEKETNEKEPVETKEHLSTSNVSLNDDNQHMENSIQVNQNETTNHSQSTPTEQSMEQEKDQSKTESPNGVQNNNQSAGKDASELIKTSDTSLPKESETNQSAIDDSSIIT